MHKIHVMNEAWALTFRGPWKDEWKEKYNLLIMDRSVM